MNMLISDIASLVFLVALVMLGIGLMRPSALAYKNRVPTRKQIGLGFGAVIIICMVVVSVNSPEQSTTNHASQKTSQAATASKQQELQTKAPVSNTPASTNTTPTPRPTTSDKANALAQMSTIQADLSGAWSSCQSDTSSCQAKVAAITDYQKLYDSNSSNFSGKASDDFSSWRIDIGTAEGDMKQWAINKSFDRPSDSLTADMVGQEVQNVQGDVNSFGND